MELVMATAGKTNWLIFSPVTGPVKGTNDFRVYPKTQWVGNPRSATLTVTVGDRVQKIRLIQNGLQAGVALIQFKSYSYQSTNLFLNYVFSTITNPNSFTLDKPLQITATIDFIVNSNQPFTISNAYSTISTGTYTHESSMSTLQLVVPNVSISTAISTLVVNDFYIPENIFEDSTSQPFGLLWEGTSIPIQPE